MRVIPLAVALGAAGLSLLAWKYSPTSDLPVEQAAADVEVRAQALGSNGHSMAVAPRESGGPEVRTQIPAASGGMASGHFSTASLTVAPASLEPRTGRVVSATEAKWSSAPSTSTAASVGGTASKSVAANRGSSYRPSTERGRLAGALVQRWSGYVQQVYGTAPMEWAGAMADTLAEADIVNLKQAAERGTYESMMGTLLGQGTSDAEVINALAMSDGGASTVQALGSAANDLVYTMVSPCRILDTRNAIGRLSGGVPRGIFVHGANFTAQGGSSTNCGIPADPSAVAINVVAVTPDNGGFITIYPSGSMRPTASSMNYEAGKILANEVIARTTLGQANDLEIFSQYGTDVVIDIVGYFMAPVATALDCTSVAGTGGNYLAGSTVDVNGGSCAAGYAAVGGQCETVNSDANIVDEDLFGSTFACQAGGPTAGSVTAVTRCCRVPGR